MKKSLLIFTFICSYYSITYAQITQNFEGPLSNGWEGTGSIVGAQDQYSPHGGAWMYELYGGDFLYCPFSLSAATKNIGVWVNVSWDLPSLYVRLFDFLTGNILILDIGTYTPSQSKQWVYYSCQLGAGYTGNYIIAFENNYGYVYLDNISITNVSYTNTNVNELSLNDFMIYPNPSAIRKFNIAFGKAMDDLNIELFDVTGKLLYSEKTNVFVNENKEIYTETLSKGIYALKISNDFSYFVKKIIIE